LFDGGEQWIPLAGFGVVGFDVVFRAEEGLMRVGELDLA
jgi:hypothetical protein